MIVQHNMQASISNRNLGISEDATSKSTEKLSSGYRINRAGDDAAGLSISEKMRSQIRGLNQASTNAQNGISLIQTAEGALNEVHSILQRMDELSVQAANDTNVSGDRQALAKEMTQLSQEISRIASTTQFNKQNLLNGSLSSCHLQVGANSGQEIRFDIKALTASNLGIYSTNIGSGITAASVSAYMSGVFATYTSATNYIKVIQSAITQVSDQRSKLGAIQNRLEHTIANTDVAAENTQSAESLIRDVDMAAEMVTYSKYNILQQAGQSMLAQANQATQGVLSLF
jgi:flagellin